MAFSQEGYDANLRINIPQLDFFESGGFDYYYFDGKYGGEDDKGFRYGLEVQPINDLRIGVSHVYDDGGEKFCGDIVYVYNFGIPQKRESAVAFSPDLFAPVLREYSQRISIAETTPFAFITTAMTTTRRITTSAMTTTICFHNGRVKNNQLYDGVAVIHRDCIEFSPDLFAPVLREYSRGSIANNAICFYYYCNDDNEKNHYGGNGRNDFFHLGRR